MNQKTIIIKLGGSIVTEKNRTGVYIRRKLLARIADEIAEVLRIYKNMRLIIIHGAGSAGHQLARKYDIGNGTIGDSIKEYGALVTRVACQKLDLTITEIFLNHGVMVSPVHTASVIIQKNKHISNISYESIDRSLDLSCIPVMYGEMAFDETLGMSVCSGDAIAMNLTNKYNASKIIFASDVDGIFDKDPHKHKDARLIANTTLESIANDGTISLTGSHNVDVTGGLQNKITVLLGDNTPKSLKKVVVCNGLKPGVLIKAFSDKELGTVIRI